MALDTERLKEILGSMDTSIHRQIFRMDEADMLTAIEVIGKEIEPRFVVDDENRNCLINLVKWLVCDSSMQCLSVTTNQRIQGKLNRGIYLFGKTGTGKTLAIKILESLSAALGLTYKCMDAVHHIKWGSYRTDEIVDKYIHGDLLTDIKREPIVCFHDLGSEPSEALYMGTRMNVMRNILEQRGDNRSTMTLFTSNFPPNCEEIRKLYGDRVASRLADMTNFLVLKGPDRRLTP